MEDVLDIIRGAFKWIIIVLLIIFIIFLIIKLSNKSTKKNTKESNVKEIKKVDESLDDEKSIVDEESKETEDSSNNGYVVTVDNTASNTDIGLIGLGLVVLTSGGYIIFKNKNVTE